MKTNPSVQTKGCYEFSIEKTTQSPGKTLLIKQDGQSLKLFLQENCNVYPVEKHLIEGLPKASFVPREFFDSCHAKVTNIGTEKRVTFSQNIKGGMQNDLVDTIRSNIENDYEEELSEKELDLVMEAFTKVISTGVKEEQEKILSEQLEKFNSTGQPHLGKALIYGLERADGKYALFLIIGIPLAKFAYSYGKKSGWW